MKIQKIAFTLSVCKPSALLPCSSEPRACIRIKGKSVTIDNAHDYDKAKARRSFFMTKAVCAIKSTFGSDKNDGCALLLSQY